MIRFYPEPSRTSELQKEIAIFSSPLCPVWLAVAPVAYILPGAAASRVIGQESAGSQEPGAATLTRGSSYTLQPCPLSGDPSTIPAQGNTNQGQPGVNTAQLHTATVSPVWRSLYYPCTGGGNTNQGQPGVNTAQRAETLPCYCVTIDRPAQRNMTETIPLTSTTAHWTRLTRRYAAINSVVLYRYLPSHCARGVAQDPGPPHEVTNDQPWR